MRNSYTRPHKNKTFFYAFLIAVILGISVISIQDIDITTQHTTKVIDLNLEN